MSLISKTVAELRHLLANLHLHTDPEVKAVAAKADGKLDELEQHAAALGHQARAAAHPVDPAAPAGVEAGAEHGKDA